MFYEIDLINNFRMAASENNNNISSNSWFFQNTQTIALNVEAKKCHRSSCHVKILEEL